MYNRFGDTEIEHLTKAIRLMYIKKTFGQQMVFKVTDS
jgi:hypothetical protein